MFLSIVLVCFLLRPTRASHELPGPGEENSCRCDFADITGTCVCTDMYNASSMDDLLDTHSDLFCSNQSTLIRSAQFVRLPQLRSIAGNRSLLRPNCSLNYLTNLSLSLTGLVQLDANSFLDFPGLVSLNFSYNQRLNSYGDGAFSPFGAQLTTMIAQHNPVRSLTRDVFRGLHALQKLVLSDNKIGYIESGVFSRNCCAVLRELRLDNNILTVLDSDTFLGLERLEVLDLRNNPLQQIDPGSFTHAATTLAELYMSHSDATPFGGFETPHPDLFMQLNRLTVLQMDQLKIKNLTAMHFRGLSNLRILSLRGNRLSQLPSDVFSNLKRLEQLDLSANLLVCVSSALNPAEQWDFLTGLPLKWIDLSWNRLTHLNQLTIRSLGLFEPGLLDGTRIVLNLTANPWQNIDDDAFCGPPASPIIRPTDIILGPVPSTAFGAWRTSLGLWVSRAQWPDGPLALIGSKSRLYGMMLDDVTTKRMIKLSEDEPGFARFGYALLGSEDSERRCQQFRANKRSRRASNDTADLSEIKRPSPISIAYSLASYCPRLLIHKLEDWELANLKVTELIDTYDSMGKSTLRTTDRGSRMYLLVIVGVCITFLLIALTVIMCYRAWSRRTSQKCGNSDFGGCPTGLTLEGPTEKQLLLRHQALSNNNVNQNSNIVNTHAADNGHGETRQQHRHSHSYHTNNSIPVDGQRSAEAQTNGVQPTKTTTSVIESNDSDPVTAISRPISPNSTTNPQSEVCAVIPISRTHLRSGRPKSDSDANEIDTSNKLTAFGVV